MTTMHENEQDQADRLDAAWNAAIGRDDGDPAAIDPMLAEQLQRIHGGLATPQPTPEYLARLRHRLTAPQPTEREPATNARLGLVALPMPAMPRARPAIGRIAAIVVVLAVVLGVAFAVAWPAEDGGAPLVASALATSEAVSPTANPTSAALLSARELRTVGAPVSLWVAPAIGTPHAALSPSTPVELLAETTGRGGDRWLQVRAASGATGWVRAQDMTTGER